MPGLKRSKEGMKGGNAKRVKMTPMHAKNTIKKVVENYLKRKSELKELTAYNTGSLSTAGAIIGAINLPSEGSDYNNRIGRHISSKQIQVDFYASILAGAANALLSDNVMVALVYDSQPESASTTYGTIWDTSAAPGGIALKNTYLDSDRFHIAWIEQMAINSNGPSGFHFRKFYRVPDHLQRTEFSGTTNQLQAGGWYLTLACTTAGTTVNYLSNVKYQFTDL